MSEITNEVYTAYTLGRQASLRDDGLDTNPFTNTSGLEFKYWEDGFNTEEEHTRLLSIDFAAKKVLEEKMEMQEERIKTLGAKLIVEETYKDKYRKKLSDTSKERDVYEQFIKRLRDKPPRWAKQYKEMVAVFCKSIGI